MTEAQRVIREMLNLRGPAREATVHEWAMNLSRAGHDESGSPSVPESAPLGASPPARHIPAPSIGEGREPSLDALSAATAAIRDEFGCSTHDAFDGAQAALYVAYRIDFPSTTPREDGEDD